MKLAIRVVSPLLFLGLVALPAKPLHAQIIQWNVQPPNYYNDIGRQAFHDGIEAAHRDFDSHRDMDPWHYPQMRNPPVPPEQRERYRDAFLRGYDEGMHRARGWDDHDRDNAWRDNDHRDRPYQPQ
jgi:hypothetical protein